MRSLATALLFLVPLACTPRPDEPTPERRSSGSVLDPPPPDGAPRERPKPITLGHGEKLVYEGRSAFSHFLVKDVGTSRGLYFVRDSGEVVLESSLDREVPHHLLVAYTKVMFVSYLFRAEHKSSLIVGLGGGAMVHFLQHYDKEQRVDAVEIDPEIVKAAKQWFGVKENDKTRIITEDAFVFLKKTTEKYDVIYMDAFLKPSGETDDTGVPLRMKTIAFLKEDVLPHLVEGGVVVFNINGHDKIDEDVKTIQGAFPQAYFFPVPDTDNYIVVGSTVPARLTREQVKKAGEATDERLKADISFKKMAGYLADKIDRPSGP
jgi:spermidine synthase